MNEKYVGKQLLPKLPAENIQPRIRGQNQKRKKQRHQVGRIDSEKPSDKKAAPFFAMLLETEMNAETADHEKDRHPGLPNHPYGKKPKERTRHKKIPQHTIPGQCVITKRQPQRMKQKYRQDRNASRAIEKIKVLDGVLHSQRS